MAVWLQLGKANQRDYAVADDAGENGTNWICVAGRFHAQKLRLEEAISVFLT